MGCSFSGLNALYDAVNGGGDVWINENRLRIVRQLGEGGFAYMFLVMEVVPDSSSASGGGLAKKIKDSSHLSELVREEIRVSLLFRHPNLLPLLDHAIISVTPTPDRSWQHEAYLLFPVHLDGTLLDNAKAMQAKTEFDSTIECSSDISRGMGFLLSEYALRRIWRQPAISNSKCTNQMAIRTQNAVRPPIDDIIIHVDKLI